LVDLCARSADHNRQPDYNPGPAPLDLICNLLNVRWWRRRRRRGGQTM